MKKLYFICCLILMTFGANLQAQSEGPVLPEYKFTPDGIVDASQSIPESPKIRESHSLLAGQKINFAQACEANKISFENINLVRVGDWVNLPCGENLNLNVKVKAGESIWLLTKIWNKELRTIALNDSLLAKADVELPSAIVKEIPESNWKLFFAILYSIILILIIVTASIFIIRFFKFYTLYKKVEQS